mmetsp:Transcript_113218/g.365849  ORF Transcript_113218/g.365849 Transcript_113218/m.365849 type:complete len:219 (-) Transcript_113218:804-1460(-)
MPDGKSQDDAGNLEPREPLDAAHASLSTAPWGEAKGWMPSSSRHPPSGTSLGSGLAVAEPWQPGTCLSGWAPEQLPRAPEGMPGALEGAGRAQVCSQPRFSTLAWVSSLLGSAAPAPGASLWTWSAMRDTCCRTMTISMKDGRLATSSLMHCRAKAVTPAAVSSGHCAQRSRRPSNRSLARSASGLTSSSRKEKPAPSSHGVAGGRAVSSSSKTMPME